MDNDDSSTHHSHRPAHNDRADSHSASEQKRAQQAANLIRNKLDGLYDSEPDATTEAQEAAQITKGRSRHQEFVYQLSNSGKSVAEIQTAWHNYYTDLPDDQKHEVWREFYAANNQSSHFMRSQPDTAINTQPTVVILPEPENIVESPGPLTESTVNKVRPLKAIHHKTKNWHRPRSHKETQNHTVADVKKQILGNIKPRRKLKARQHLQSLIFGLGMGSFVSLILLFGFFNERFIAPFISPSKHVSSTPLIIDPSSPVIDPNPKVIIPKINIDTPVIYDQPSIEESAVQASLENGTLHYATTPYPGELGNAVIFGHSSSNIFNTGKYKFAFVLLSRLEKGDLFYLTKDGKRYVYQVYKKEVVEPTNLSVLNATEKPATATLITCDPPGSSLRRLVVVGEQISPSPSANTASTAVANSQSPVILPSNSPSLWGRFVNWLTD